MSSNNHSAQIAEALATFSKSVYRTCSDIENRSKAEVARSVEDALQARNERDEVTRDHRASQQETFQLKQDLAVLAVSLKHAEQTIAQQSEIILQLRREVVQVRDQAQNWQEHYLRVEKERCALSTKIDELVDSRRTEAPLDQAPLTPVSRYADELPYKYRSSPSASGSISKPTLPISPSDADSPLQSVSTTNRAARQVLIPPKTPRPKQSGRQTPRRDPNDVSQNDEHKSRTLPAQTPLPKPKPTTTVSSRVIRRVQAVIRVKEEEDDDEKEPPIYPEPEQDEATVSPKNRAKSTGKRSRKVVQEEEDEWEPSGDEKSQGEAEGEDDDEEDDEDDDELMMGAQRNGRESYGAALKTPSRAARPPTPPSKRRKVSGPGRQKPAVKRKP